MPVGEGDGEFDPRIIRRVHQILYRAHRENAKLPIRGPDEDGAFPGSGGRAWGVLGGGVPPVVVDANTMRHEVLRTCRSGQTILITAANVGAIRLYAASHVIEEVAEHHATWAAESKHPVSAEQFWSCWQRQYLRLLRIVDDEHLSADLLCGGERTRLVRLEAVDVDDPPSVILSLCLGAFFLSEDPRAVRAVYGEGVDLEKHRSWLAVLRSSGDAGEIGKLIFGAVMLPTALGAGVYQGLRWASQYVSLLRATPIALGLGALILRRIGPRERERLRSGLGEAATAFLYLYMRYQSAFDAFRRATAPAPPPGELATELDDRSLAQRSYMHTLARASSGVCTLIELLGGEPSVYYLDQDGYADSRGAERARPAIEFTQELWPVADAYFAEYLDGRDADYEDIANLAGTIAGAISGEYENPGLRPLLGELQATGRSIEAIQRLASESRTTSTTQYGAYSTGAQTGSGI